MLTNYTHTHTHTNINDSSKLIRSKSYVLNKYFKFIMYLEKEKKKSRIIKLCFFVLSIVTSFYFILFTCVNLTFAFSIINKNRDWTIEWSHHEWRNTYHGYCPISFSVTSAIGRFFSYSFWNPARSHWTTIGNCIRGK